MMPRFLSGKLLLSSHFICEQQFHISNSYSSPRFSCSPGLRMVCIRFTRYMLPYVFRVRGNVIYFLDNFKPRTTWAASPVLILLPKILKCFHKISQIGGPSITKIASMTDLFLTFLTSISNDPHNINFIHIPTHFFVSVKYCKSKYHDFFII